MCTGRAAVSALVALALTVSVAAAQRYDPSLRFRTIRTAHFDVHAHQGEEALARRLAVIVERTRTAFEPVLGVPRGRVQVILVDQTDLSNGWATPLPRDTIELTAVPPPAESLIGNTTDWLEVVFTHEYTHILHLDRSHGLMQGVRRVFGRVPVAFPNTFLPVWQVEGIATFEESRMTGQGRVPAGDFDAIVSVAAAQGRFEPLDRASGGLVDWPAGNAPYAYGAYFHQYLADTYGAERIARLADTTAGRVPLFGAGAFTAVFGRSEDQLWNDFRDARQHAPVPHSETDGRAKQLTHHGFVVTAPGVAAGGTMYYAVSNADGYPALMALSANGRPRRVAWRAFGNRTSVREPWIVFDQLERVRSVALFSDLYAVRSSGPKAGTVFRLTRHARAGDPDLSPDGRRIVCTIQATGRRALALLDFSPAAPSAPRVLIDDPDADFTGPRWSPDGTRIVAARRRPGADEVVLIDPATRLVTVLAARIDARLVTPSWAPDGATVLFAATEGTAPFNILSVDVATRAVRQITDTAGGAQFPELRPDGTLIYVGYTPAGYDLFALPPGGRAAPQPTDAFLPQPAVRTAPIVAPVAADRRYSPGRTLAPTFWTPTIQTDAGETLFGAATAMADALGRHAYAVDAAWSTARPRPDWHAAYAYDRWRATLFGSYSDDTDPVRGGTIRSRDVFAGALLPFRRLRWSDTLLAGFDAQTETLACATIGNTCRARALHRDFRSVRGGWLHDSRRIFGYSVSPEEGVAIEAAADVSRKGLGSDVDAGAAVFDARGFRRLSGHAVIAARVATAASWGPLNARRLFSAAGPGPSSPVFDFGRDTIGLLRGFSPEDVVGSRAATVNLDLRFPLLRVQRGAGAWPVFVRELHAAAFADLGNAWDAAFRRADTRTSIGGELSLDVVVAHYLPLTFATGAAWTRDPVTRLSRGAIFGRIGRAF